jgi:mono/diheme cytochrome c family protein
MKPVTLVFPLFLALLGLNPVVARAQSKVDFNRDIRPILSDACFQCHGPDVSQRKADLRLDTKTGLFGGNEPVVPGKPDESELLRRLVSDDPQERMPPPKSGKKLTARQIALVRDWIAQGAPFAGHWSFIPPERPPLPAVKNEGWVRTPIDRFILARLEREELAPAPEADRTTLLRRMSLDLIGLPPTIAETDAFLRDNSSDAVKTIVERLLSSPHYGERWARHWLDAARYADSDGYEKDKPRFVWMYRDWVVNAINRDLPYNQFIVEQIAGDLLPNPTQDQLVATGFLRNSMINEEGGIDPEQFRMEAMFDRMDAIGKSVLGLTIQCSQCHNHKFDPLTQEEYYRMFAFLNNSHEANIAAYTPEELQQRGEIFRTIRELEAELQHRRPDWPERMAAWEDSVKNDQPEWTTIQTAEDDLSGGQKMYRLKDGSYLCQGYAPTKHTVTIPAIRTEQQNITAFRLEQLNDPNLPLGGPGRSIKGTSALSEFKVKVWPTGKPNESQWIKFVKATSDANPPEKPLEEIYDDKTKTVRTTGPVEFAIDGKNETAWCTDIGPGRRNHPCKAVFVAEKPFSFPEGTEIEVHLVQMHGGWNSDDNQNHNLGRFRLSITSAEEPVADPVPAKVREIFAIPREQRSPAQVAAVFSFWRTTVPEWKETNEKIEELWQRHPEGASQLVLKERHEMRMTHRLERGDFLKPKEAVEPGVPAFLNPLPADAPLDRLTFARWLADRNSPTTARAVVNRVWQSYFGTGLTATSEEFGSQGEIHSHPELLDWLAVEFMESGWSLKNLHRLIVNSAVYRQSSRVTPESYARDPYNRLLSRGPRFRVDAEVVRDIFLAASGLLNEEVGGPPVYPPAPDFLFQPPASYGPKVWKESTGEDRYRRALYTFRFRSVPYPALQNFDAPNGDFSCVRRSRSNTPMQALTTLNEPLFVECAQALAQKTLKEGGPTDADRLTYAFRRCVSRQPTNDEKTTMLALVAKQMKRFADGTANPMEIIAAKPDQQVSDEITEGTAPAQLAAWTVVARVILNLDETITKE